MKHLKYTVAVAGTKVVNTYLRLIFKLLHRFYMAFCQIYHMDVITHSGAVRCIVIVSKHAELFQLANCHLCNIRNKVIRYSFRIFANDACLMGSDRIKITKQHYIPFRVRHMQVCQNLLQHAFRLSIRIRNLTFRTILRDWHKGRISINSC